MAFGRWLLLGVAAAVASALVAVAGPLAQRGQERDWAAEARAAAERSIRDGARAADGVQSVGVAVRPAGNVDERWVCGSFAVRDEEGSLGPFRDFWITVAKAPDSPADALDVRANRFGHDDFLDRGSAHFRACFAPNGTG